MLINDNYKYPNINSVNIEIVFRALWFYSQTYVQYEYMWGEDKSFNVNEPKQTGKGTRRMEKINKYDIVAWLYNC